MEEWIRHGVDSETTKEIILETRSRTREHWGRHDDASGRGVGHSCIL